MGRLSRKLVTILLIAVMIFIHFSYPTEACCKKQKVFEGKIDIGGYKLFVHCEGKNRATVLFDSGYGDGYDVWEDVQDMVSANAETVSYDRAGLGRSDKSTNPRTSMYMVKEWHTLLQKAKINGPYILVGHSMGGFNVRLFASMYPDEVKGIILVDSSHEDQDARIISKLPPEVQDIFKSQFNSEGSYEDYLVSSEQVRATRDAIKNIPLTVISATEHGMGSIFENVWMDMQKDLLTLSERSRHIVVCKCDHYIHENRPRVVARAINDMIKLVG